jgi:hypothetical protein
VRTDPDGLPCLEDRLKMASALRSALNATMPHADADLVAAVAAMAASRFFGVRFRAEGNTCKAWVARRPSPDVFEVWDPSDSRFVWDLAARLANPTDYRPTPEGTARVAARAQGEMAAVVDTARAAHALAAGLEADDI